MQPPDVRRHVMRVRPTPGAVAKRGMHALSFRPGVDAMCAVHTLCVTSGHTMRWSALGGRDFSGRTWQVFRLHLLCVKVVAVRRALRQQCRCRRAGR